MHAVPGGTCEARLADITEHGCCLYVDASMPRPNQLVSLDVGSEGSIAAVVRWRRDGQAGLEFGRPLARAIVNRLSSCG